MSNSQLQSSQRSATAFSADQRTRGRRIALFRDFIGATRVGYHAGK